MKQHVWGNKFLNHTHEMYSYFQVKQSVFLESCTAVRTCCMVQALVTELPSVMHSDALLSFTSIDPWIRWCMVLSVQNLSCPISCYIRKSNLWCEFGVVLYSRKNANSWPWTFIITGIWWRSPWFSTVSWQFGASSSSRGLHNLKFLHVTPHGLGVKGECWWSLPDVGLTPLQLVSECWGAWSSEGLPWRGPRNTSGWM
jgi:hypothetical protein